MQPINVIKNACPICKGAVKGGEGYKFFCKKCNVLFEEKHLLNKGVEARSKTKKTGKVKSIEDLLKGGEIKNG